MKARNIFSRIVIFSAIGSLILIAGLPQEGNAQKAFWKLGTAGSGGTFYFLGSGIANVINKHVPEIKLTPEATGGGIENLRRMSQGQLELALISPWDMPVVLKDGSAKLDRISFFCGGHDSVLYAVARKSSGWKTAKEAMRKGAKVATGAPGSGVRTSSQMMLRAFDLTIEDIKSFPLSQNEAAEALKDGTIDIFCGGSGIPLAAVSNITESIEAVVLGFSKEDISRLQKETAYMFGATVPPKTYRGQNEEVVTPGYASLLVVWSDLNPNLVAKTLHAIYEHSNEIAQIHPAGKEINLERVYLGFDYAHSLGFKFHPGVIQYLKERNKWEKKYE